MQIKNHFEISTTFSISKKLPGIISKSLIPLKNIFRIPFFMSENLIATQLNKISSLPKFFSYTFITN